MTPEGKVKDSVKRVLKKKGVWHYMPVQNGMGVVGIPDIIACVPVEITPDMVGKSIGVFMAVETKAPGKIKNTTPNQRNVLERIAHCNGVAIVADEAVQVENALSILNITGTPLYNVPT